MFYKIGVYGGGALTAILIVENIVVVNYGALFWERNAPLYMIIIVTTIIG